MLYLNLRPNIIRVVPYERTVLLVYLFCWLWPFHDGYARTAAWV